MDSAGWDARYAATDLVWSAEPNRFVAEILTGWPAGRALDLACGEGRNAIWLAGLGWEVVGVDFSAVAIEKADGRARDAGVDVTWVRDDVLHYEPKPAAFDLVLIAYLQLPAPELDRVLANAVVGLAPGGALLMVAHARRNLTEGTGGPQDPAVLYAPDDVVARLDGLTVERADDVLRAVDTPDGPRTAIDVVVLAHQPGTGRM
jgi:SAM-dependent methyltransferase